MIRRNMLPALLLPVLAAGAAYGQGVLLPTDANQPPVALQSHRVQVVIDDHVAETRDPTGLRQRCADRTGGRICSRCPRTR